MKKLFNRFGSWLAKTLGVGSLGNYLSSVASNYAKKYGETGLTDREKETVDYQTGAQNVLNEQEFDRKIDFYERYESPQARVAQYKAAGLNPMLLAGNGASVSASGGVGSAGSAAAPSSPEGGLASIIGTIMQVKAFQLQKKQIEQVIRESQAKTVSQQIENKYRDKANALRLKSQELQNQIYGTQINLNEQTLQKMVHETNYAETMALFAPQLFQSQVDEREANAYNAKMSGELSDARKAEVESIVAKNRSEKEKIDAEISKVQIEIQVLASQSELNSAKADEARQNIRESVERIKKIGKEIGLFGLDMKYYLWNHAKQTSFGLKGISMPITAESGRTPSGDVSLLPDDWTNSD